MVNDGREKNIPWQSKEISQSLGWYSNLWAPYAITGQRFSRLRSPVVIEFVKEKYQHFNPVTAFVPVHP